MTSRKFWISIAAVIAALFLFGFGYIDGKTTMSVITAAVAVFVGAEAYVDAHHQQQKK